MRKIYIFLIIIVLLGGYVSYSSANGPYEPLGRLGFVKLANPDMYPGHVHSKLLAQYAEDRGSKCALVVHYGGSSNYRHYMEGDVLILELAYVENKTYTPGINWTEVYEEGVYGIPSDKWTYRADGKSFETLDEALAYIQGLADKKGQQGPIPLVYHGTVRSGSPIINQGCGFPLYYQILRTKYGVLESYLYVLKGIIFPYLNLPYRNYELENAAKLQYYYTHNMLNYE